MDEVPVNWCPALGTVLANEEVIDGRSEVGGFPVERRPMRQWMLRITAYADRLLEDLDMLDWSESLKEMQRNWIGRSTGATVEFEIDPASIPGNAANGFAQDSEPQPPRIPPAPAGATPVSPSSAAAKGGTGGAPVSEGDDLDLTITVFTTRPDTLYGATYMVLAPEHPLVDRITAPTHRETIEAYRKMVASQSERDRMLETKEKSGVFTGAYAINPINDARIPVYIADYVLMGYGTGAIMAVPAHDQRDYEFAKKFNLPIIYVVRPPSGEMPTNRAFEGDGIADNSPLIDGLPTPEAKEKIVSILQREGNARRSVNYKLRDWLFSRQRYWGEPFPILLDDDGNAYAVDESELPVTLPEMSDFKPTGTPEPPLSKAPQSWLRVERDGKVFTRETNTMPQWAGSCWYYLRFCDPKSTQHFVDPQKEQYWMAVDLYVGGVEHAVLHLLYARFWHKVLYDLDYVSTPEPFLRLVNQGLILGEMEFHVFENAEGVAISTAELTNIREEATAERVIMLATHAGGENCVGRRICEDEVEKRESGYVLKANPAMRIDARSFKMSKSRGNVANPDDLVRDYGADALRLYVMYMGPLEAQKPWNTRDIVGMTRFLNSAWRNLVGDEEAGKTAAIADTAIPDAIDRQMHRTIKKVAEDIEQLRFNTAIAELIKLNNEMNKLEAIPRTLAENFALMLSPFAPHMAEEIWQRLGHEESLAHHPWPAFDQAKLVESTMELPVQVNGKLRDKITVPADAGEETILTEAQQARGVQSWLAGKQIKKRIYVPGKLVNFVVG